MPRDLESLIDIQQAGKPIQKFSIFVGNFQRNLIPIASFSFQNSDGFPGTGSVSSLPLPSPS
jgi:hypothetical protein